jgi:hypothetical protein
VVACKFTPAGAYKGAINSGVENDTRNHDYTFARYYICSLKSANQTSVLIFFLTGPIRNPQKLFVLLPTDTLKRVSQKLWTGVLGSHW